MIRTLPDPHLEVGLELIDAALALQVPDHDALLRMGEAVGGGGSERVLNNPLFQGEASSSAPPFRRLSKPSRTPPPHTHHHPLHPNAHLGSGAQPVAVGGEDQRVDDLAGVQAVQALALSQVPQHGNSVL